MTSLVLWNLIIILKCLTLSSHLCWLLTHLSHLLRLRIPKHLTSVLHTHLGYLSQLLGYQPTYPPKLPTYSLAYDPHRLTYLLRLCTCSPPMYTPNTPFLVYNHGSYQMTSSSSQKPHSSLRG
jgi:hypothetical protein